MSETRPGAATQDSPPHTDTPVAAPQGPALLGAALVLLTVTLLVVSLLAAG